MSENAFRRVFFALWPDPAVAGKLFAAAERAHRRCGGRCTRRETLHLTLAFIGPVDPPSLDRLMKIGGSLAGWPVDALRLDRLGYWKHNRIVWAGAERAPEALAILVRELGAALGGAGFEIDRRPFVPHVTLIRKAACRQALPALEAIEWQPVSLVLTESLLDREGARYQTVAQWALSAQPSA